MDMTVLAELSWAEFITIGAAILGAALGIMNTWNSFDQRRVRMRVRPAHAIVPYSDHPHFCVEVINLSGFPITVSEVGFTLKGAKRMPICRLTFLDGRALPRRLEAREAMTAYFDPTELMALTMSLGKAYARTSCGEQVVGSSPALRQLRDVLARQI